MKSILKIVKYIVLFSITILVIGGIVLRNKQPNLVGDLLEPVAVVSQVTSSGELKKTDGRTNVLVLGIDKRSEGNVHSSSNLTDTIMVVSIDEKAENPAMISLPRDIWIEQTRSKVNSIYPLCLMTQAGSEDPQTCVDKTVSAVEYVAGIPIHYYVIVGFDAFEEAIDSVGGIDIYIDEEFDDYKYPIEGKENAMPESARYKHIHFDSGWQHLDSEQALEYSRSRHSTNPNEQGDFARSRRQQKVIIALKDTLLSSETLLNPSTMKELYESYKRNVNTNATLADALVAYELYKDAEDINITKIVLSNEQEDEELHGSGTLAVPTREERDALYNGLYVLVPNDRTFQYIHSMIRTVLFSDNTDSTDNTNLPE